jgi:hypothetical protein
MTLAQDLRHLAIQARSLGELPLFWGALVYGVPLVSAAMAYAMVPA